MLRWALNRVNRDRSAVGRAQQTQRTQKFGKRLQAAVALHFVVFSLDFFFQLE